MNIKSTFTLISRFFWIFLGTATSVAGALFSPAIARSWTLHDPVVYFSLTFMAAGLWFFARSTAVFRYSGSPLSHAFRGLYAGFVFIPMDLVWDSIRERMGS